MAGSKGWEWEKANQMPGLKPCEDSYCLTNKWLDLGYKSFLDLDVGLGWKSEVRVMAIREVLLLGNENLYKVSKAVSKDEIDKAGRIIKDLHDTMMNFRKKHGFGRAIAAPQINELFRIIYINIDDNPVALINPELELIDNEKFEMWDDCMSFPGLEVRLYRYKKCRIYYKDLEWNDCVLEPSGDISELIQHEYDHLNGILAVQRAIDNMSFRINKDKTGCF